MSGLRKGVMFLEHDSAVLPSSAAKRIMFARELLKPTRAVNRKGSGRRVEETPQGQVESGAKASAGDPRDWLSRVGAEQDRACFTLLFEEFAPRVKGYLLRLGVPRDEAEGVLQDVMLTVWTKAKLYDPKKASPSTWIFTVARNRFIDRVRRKKRPEPDAEDPVLQPAEVTQSDDQVGAGQEAALLHEALTALPEEQYQVIAMAFLEDKTHTQIADEIGLPLGTVKSRIRLAMGTLRPKLKDLR